MVPYLLNATCSHGIAAMLQLEGLATGTWSHSGKVHSITNIDLSVIKAFLSRAHRVQIPKFSRKARRESSR